MFFLLSLQRDYISPYVLYLFSFKGVQAALTNILKGAVDVHRLHIMMKTCCSPQLYVAFYYLSPYCCNFLTHNFTILVSSPSKPYCVLPVHQST